MSDALNQVPTADRVIAKVPPVELVLGKQQQQSRRALFSEPLNATKEPAE